MVAAHYYRSHTRTGNLGHRVANHTLRVRGRSWRIENVSCQQDAIDALAFGDIHDFGAHLLLLIEPRASKQGLSDMPVGGMQKPHRVEPCERVQA